MTDIAKQTREFNKLKKRLRRQVGQAIADYNMIADGDKARIRDGVGDAWSRDHALGQPA